MKKQSFSKWVLGGAAALCTLASCHIGSISGSGHVVSQHRVVGEFSSIKISDALHVELLNDNAQGINVSADDNLIKYIHTQNVGGRLSVYTSKSLNNTHILIRIGVRSLTGLNAMDAVIVNAEDTIRAQNLELKASDASRIHLKVDARQVDSHCSGASELYLSGRAQVQQANLTDASGLQAYELITDSAKLKATDASYARVYVKRSLDVNAQDAASVNYKGTPALISNKVSDAASLKQVH